jgi:tripartite-type tricarboxylate transporter receptor subunit TctC
MLHRLGLIALCLLLTQAAAPAQDWPTRPIRAIIPFGAGSATDLVPRIVFEQLSSQLGQPIVVENRTGAGGTLGTSAVAKADSDGYTLLAHSNALTVAPAIYSNLPYDTVNDFTAIIPFGSLPAVLIMSPEKGFKTIQAMLPRPRPSLARSITARSGSAPAHI